MTTDHYLTACDEFDLFDASERGARLPHKGWSPRHQRRRAKQPHLRSGIHRRRVKTVGR